MRFSSLLFFSLIFSCLVLGEIRYEEPWGKDTDLLSSQRRSPLSYPPPSLATFLAQKVILFHQKVISPVDGPRSHFKPCSSQYMKLAMQKYGFWKGFIMGCDRLQRENKAPWVYKQILVDGKLIKYDPPK